MPSVAVAEVEEEVVEVVHEAGDSSEAEEVTAEANELRFPKSPSFV